MEEAKQTQREMKHDTISSQEQGRDLQETDPNFNLEYARESPDIQDTMVHV